MHRKARDSILSALTKTGARGATITEIEAVTSFERHTLSKYLSLMEKEGLVYHRAIGKAKLYFVNKTPLRTIVESSEELRTYNEKLFLDILDKTPMAIIITDENFIIQYINKIALKFYGDCRDQPLYSCVLGEKVLPRKFKSISSSKKTHFEMEILDPDERKLFVRGSRIRNPDDTLSFIWILDDVSKQKDAEERLHRYTAQVKIKDDLTRALVETGLERQKVLATTTKAVSNFSSDTCSVELVENGSWRLASVSNDEKEIEEIFRKVLSENDTPHKNIRDKVLSSSNTILLQDEELEPVISKVSPKYRKQLEGLKSLIVSPLRMKGENLGIMSIWSLNEDNPYTESDTEFLATLANRVSLAIDRSRKERDHQEKLS